MDYYNEEKYDGCEEIKAFLNKVNSFIEELKTKDYQNVLVVTHKGVVRAFEVIFNGIGDGKMFDMGIKNCDMKAFET